MTGASFRKDNMSDIITYTRISHVSRENGKKNEKFPLWGRDASQAFSPSASRYFGLFLPAGLEKTFPRAYVEEYAASGCSWKFYEEEIFMDVPVPCCFASCGPAREAKKLPAKEVFHRERFFVGRERLISLWPF